MRPKQLLIAAIGGLALGLVASPGNAAPAGGAIGAGPAAAASESAAVQDVRWGRRCWRHRGHLHCRRHVRRWGPGYYYGGYPPRFYGYGYRPGFAIHAPGFGLYFGQRHRRHWW